MTRTDAVLLVTRSDDNDSVERVAHALRRRGRAPVRLDTDRYPTEITLATSLASRAAAPGRHVPASVTRTLTTADGTFDLERVTAVWYRRFHAGAALPQDLDDLRPACVEEARRTLFGMIAALPCPHVDTLESVRRCDHKELQLVRARALGLDVPDTLFTNDPAAARAFFEAHNGNVITKMQSSFAVQRDGLEHVVFTNTVEDHHLDDIDGLRFCPMTFQEHIEKRLELRATVVGDRVLCASVDSQVREDTRIDWRKDGRGLLHAWSKYALPRDVERNLLDLVHEIGLRFGACDLIVTPSGRHVFLEVNAGGEWFWLDDLLGIADALAGELTVPGSRARRRTGERTGAG